MRHRKGMHQKQSQEKEKEKSSSVYFPHPTLPTPNKEGKKLFKLEKGRSQSRKRGVRGWTFTPIYLFIFCDLFCSEHLRMIAARENVANSFLFNHPR
jgi:hypothetical protein